MNTFSRITNFNGQKIKIVIIHSQHFAAVSYIYKILEDKLYEEEAFLLNRKSEHPFVTYYEYKRIQTGMSYKQVVAIIGVEGEEISRSKMDGIPGVMESIETVMYQWLNNNGSNMNAMFQNDKLIQKAQFGLK